MTAARPLLIATLPGRSAPDCREQVGAAIEAGADLAEIRVDRWSVEDRSGLAGLFPTALPLIGTYRSILEGGEGSNDPAVRRDTLAELARQPFWGIDYESNRDAVPQTLPQGGSILSAHLAESTPWESVRAQLFRAPGASRFVKVVLPANVSEALVLLERAVPTEGGEGFLLHTTGPSGALFRALSGRLGFAAVYGSLPKTPSRPPVEPSQIPVDRLRRFYSSPDPGPIYALLGASVGRSRSPDLFSKWMERLSDPGIYIGLDIRTESELADALSVLPRYGVRGFNVTQPWKIAASNLATRAGPGAIPCRCANVLSVVPGEGLEAENTDLAAVLRRLTEIISSGGWDGREALVVGTGGAARAALSAGRALRSDLRVLGRDPSAVDALAREFGATAAPRLPDRPASLIVQATSMGIVGSGTPGVDLLPWIGPKTRILDFVYDPDDRWLESAARARRARYEGGYRLLVYQAAESYAMWFGHSVPPELVDEALEGDP